MRRQQAGSPANLYSGPFHFGRLTVDAVYQSALPGVCNLMKKILIIEDDDVLRSRLAIALRQNEYEAFEAGHGAAGLELAFSQRPDVVLCDVHLPGQNGLDVLRQLRAQPETAATPVILMTGELQNADARHSMNAGAADYLQKPFSMEQMLATLNARINRHDGIQHALETQVSAERTSAAEKIRLQTTALEAAANGILITDRHGKILWVNHAFTQLTGYTAREVAGQNPRFLNSGRHPKQFYADMWAAINAGRVWHGELVNKRKDGTCYDEEMTITPVRGEDGEIQNFVAIKQDVSERKQMEQVLAQKRDLLQSLMDNLPDHIYFKDVNSQFTRINHALAVHLGLQNPEAAIGKSDADFFPLRQARQKLVDERFLLATGKPILGLVERSDTPAGEKWVSSTKVPITGRDGQIEGLVGISRDITEIKQAEEDLLRKSAFLEAQMNSSLDGILALDEQGKKTLQNQRLTDLFVIPESIIGDTDDKILLNWITQTTQNPEQFLEKIRLVNARPGQVSRHELELKNGTILECYSAPMTGKADNVTAGFGRSMTSLNASRRRWSGNGWNCNSASHRSWNPLAIWPPASPMKSIHPRSMSATTPASSKIHSRPLSRSWIRMKPC